ncbi:MAG: hypothetical protein AB3N22_00685 [Ruegeria sp.]
MRAPKFLVRSLSMFFRSHAKSFADRASEKNEVHPRGKLIKWKGVMLDSRRDSHDLKGRFAAQDRICVLALYAAGWQKTNIIEKES